MGERSELAFGLDSGVEPLLPPLTHPATDTFPTPFVRTSEQMPQKVWSHALIQ